MRHRSAAFALALCAALLAPSQAHAAKDFNTLVDKYFDASLPHQPTEATALGLHTWDGKLENYSHSAIESEISQLHSYLTKFNAIKPVGLDESTRGDLAMMQNYLRSQLLSLETIRMWEKNPDNYSSGITNSAFVLMERKFAPPDERLKSLISREKQMPAVFTAARANLKNPPHIYTEIAIEQMPGIISFFKNDVPAAFTDATDPMLKAEFAKSNAAVIYALEQYAKWLQTDLLPRSNGDFRFGADTYRKKLLYDEMVDTPLDKLLQSFQGTFDGLIRFIRDKNIITIPSDVQPVLEETPPFMRATTSASMDPPGPFEQNSKTAYFNVTLPEKDWTPEHIAEHMAEFNVGTIVSTSVHEAYPGHYVQFLWVNHTNLSKVRKIVTANTNVEGWAHYCEQMMLDQGYAQPGVGAKDERESRLIRLGQLQDALLRDARFVVGIKMHTADMTFEQAVDFFVNEGYQSRSVGEVETKRGTADATYLYYTLGKLEIMKLRADLQEKEGAAFSLERFHDDFMKQGGAPIKIVRRALLGDDSPTL